MFPDGRVVLGRVVTDTGTNDESVVNGNLEERLASTLFFVCFTSALRSDDLAYTQRWKADQDMCLEMSKMDPGVLAYVSVPLTPSSKDWFNLVLFEDLEFIRVFETSRTHEYAKEFLSPRSFTDVCVRRGRVVHGESSISLEATRSIIINFSSDGSFTRNVYTNNLSKL